MLNVFHNCIGESLANQTVGSLTCSKGQRVFVDLAHASQDVSPYDFSARRSTLNHVLKPNVFPDPRTVNVNREPKNRYLTGDGVTRSLGVELTTKIMSQVLRAVFECNGMRRTPGLAGQLNRYKVAAENTLRYEFLDGSFLPTAWPDTMVLQVSTFHSASLTFSSF
jgi:linoleate 10R-lipoxygenase